MVLEGGSFRYEFTAGVLDVFMENGVEVSACYGVSAGALSGLNYKSRQIGPSQPGEPGVLRCRRYIGAKSFATSGSVVRRFLLNDIQDRLDPLITMRLKSPCRCMR